jgi:hypothetical protein
LTAVDISSPVTVTTNHVAILSSNTGVYETAVGGHYYLPTNSPCLMAGTGTIDPALRGLLSVQTTRVPMVYSDTTITGPANFTPIVTRDTNNAPDLGYHYDTLDYLFGGCDVASNLTFTAGTAVGWFRTSSGYNAQVGHGLHLQDGVTLSFNGKLEAPCYWMRLNLVQEQDLTAGYGPGGITTGEAALYYNDPSLMTKATVKASFLQSGALAWMDNAFRDDLGNLLCHFSNSEFYNCGLGCYMSSYFLTNCLFIRANVGVWEGADNNEFHIQNCTFKGGYIYMTPYWSSTNIPTGAFTYTIKQTVLDGAELINGNYGANTNLTSYDYNAYIGSSPFPFSGGHDVVVTNGFNWQTGWLGDYYLPPNSPLINAGGTNADQVGLYHFTTQTNQIKETNSVVDIGYHYVATDANGNSVDSNNDGTPDYKTDANGNGLKDNGEQAWGNPPVITGQPVNLTLVTGQNATNTVQCASVVPVACQWYFTNAILASATNASLVLTNIQPTKAGNYFVIVTNIFGAATSSIAQVLVVSQTEDSDYDGRNNGQELIDGKDPFDSNSVLPSRLGYWQFDNTNTWTGFSGQLPLVATNLTGVGSWNTNAVLIDSTNLAILAYRDVETNGNANINLRTGTVRFWFKPDWSTGSGALTNGGRFLEVGAQGEPGGWWAMGLTPDGSGIYLATQSPTNQAGVCSSDNTWTVYSSTNLTNWTAVDTVTLDANGNGSFTDNGISGLTNKFYRLSNAVGTSQVIGFERIHVGPAVNTNTPYYRHVADQFIQVQGEVNTLTNAFAQSVLPSGVYYMKYSSSQWQMYTNLGETWSQNTTLELGTSGFIANPTTNTFDINFAGLISEQPISISLTNPSYDTPISSSRPLHGGLVSTLGYPINLVPPEQLTYIYIWDVQIQNYRVPMYYGGDSFYPAGWYEADGETLTTEPIIEIGSGFWALNDGSVPVWTQPGYQSSSGQAPILSVSAVTSNAFTFNIQGAYLITNASVAISWPSDTWHQVVAAYSSTNVALYLDGQVVAGNGLGITIYPDATTRAKGFSVGATRSGNLQSKGVFDELETFNYPLSTEDIAANYAAAMLLDSDGDEIPNILENQLGLNPYSYNSANGLNSTNGLQVFTPLKLTTTILLF